MIVRVSLGVKSWYIKATTIYFNEKIIMFYSAESIVKSKIRGNVCGTKMNEQLWPVRCDDTVTSVINDGTGELITH